MANPTTEASAVQNAIRHPAAKSVLSVGPAVIDRPHMMTELPPRVSVVIATKDRSVLLARLLGCMQRQTLPDMEVIVVDDGSSAEVVETYSAVWSRLDERFRLQLNPPGGGPSGARNTGIRLARGEFIAFCDDDDTWVRDDHLATAVATLTKYNGDVYLVNMQQSLNGAVVAPDFYGKGGQLFKRYPIDAESGLFDVRKRQMARFLQHRVLHPNTLVVRRDLLMDIGLYWEGVHIGEDLDLSFRLADASKRVLYCSKVAADGDLSPHPSIMRRYSPESAALCVVSALVHAEYCVSDPRLRRTARRVRASRMVQLSALLLAAGKRRSALAFVMEALVLGPRPSMLRHLVKVLCSFLRG